MDFKVGIAVLMVFAVLCGRGNAADDNSCISALTPCGNYLNTTAKPDKACCDGLLGVIQNDAACLCGLLKSDLVKQANINVTKALELPSRCGKNVTADQCKSTTTTSTAPPPATAKGGSSSTSTSSSTTGTKGDSSVASPGAVFSAVPVAVLIMVGVLSHLLFGEFSTNVQMA